MPRRETASEACCCGSSASIRACSTWFAARRSATRSVTKGCCLRWSKLSPASSRNLTDDRLQEELHGQALPIRHARRQGQHPAAEAPEDRAGSLHRTRARNLRRAAKGTGRPTDDAMGVLAV